MSYRMRYIIKRICMSVSLSPYFIIAHHQMRNCFNF